MSKKVKKAPRGLTETLEDHGIFFQENLEEEIQLKTFASGASRKEIKSAGHLVCPELGRRTALICGEGLRNYPWEELGDAELTTAANGGIPLANLIRHLDNHYLLYRSGDMSEDNLAKVVWACQQIMHQESHEAGRFSTVGPCEHYRMLAMNEEDRDKVR